MVIMVIVLPLLALSGFLSFYGLWLGMEQSIGGYTFLLFPPSLYFILSIYSALVAIVVIVASISDKCRKFIFRNKVYLVLGIVCTLLVTVVVTKQPIHYIQSVAGDSYRIPWYMTHVSSDSKVDFMVCQTDFKSFQSSCRNNYTHVRIYANDDINWYTYDYFLQKRYSIKNNILTYNTLPEDARIVEQGNKIIITNSHDNYVGNNIYFIETNQEAVVKRLVLCRHGVCEHYVFDNTRVIWFETNTKNQREDLGILFKDWDQQYQMVFSTINDLQIK